MRTPPRRYGRTACTLSWLALATMLVHARAEAQTPPERRWSLQWSRGPGAGQCVGAAELSRRVAARIGRDPFGDPARAELTIEGHVASVGDGRFTVTVQVAEPDGTTRGARELDERAAGCGELDEAIVLVVAMTVDPSAAVGAPDDGGSPEVDVTVGDPASQPEPSGDAESTPAATPVPTPATPRPSPPDGNPPAAALRGELLGAARIAIAPSPVVGPGLRLAVEVDPLPPVVLEAAWYPSVDERFGEGRARFELLSAGLAVCPRVELGARLDVAVCAKGEVDRLSATARGFAQNLDAASTFGALGPALALAWRFGDATLLGLHTEAMMPLSRDRFVVESADGSERVALHRPGAIAWRIAVSVGVW